MKKILLTLFVSALAIMSFETQAQMAPGSLTPNFEAVDINGNTHNLYDYLAQDKKVILDFSATWCGPCWSYHTGGALEELWETYGPDGSDELMVFFIESDDATTQADLEGTGGNTTGDWITGTGYPIIDNGENIARDFEVGYYPTIYTVCGTGKITETGQITATAHAEFFMDMDCDRMAEALGLVGGEPVSKCDGPVGAAVELLNSGANTLNNATLVLEGCDNCPITQEWEGSLEYLQSETVEFAGVEVAEGNTTLQISGFLAGANEPTDAVEQSISLGSETALQDWTITYDTDCWPFETTWFVTDEDGTTWAQGGPYDNNTQAQITITEEFSLPTTGCFTFTVLDSYGDGFNGTAFNCPVDGNMRVESAAGVIFEVGGTKQFSIEQGNADVVESSNSEDLATEAGVTVAPNPAVDVLNINLTDVTATNVAITIIDVVGSQVYRTNVGTVAGNYNEQINVSDYASGVYSMVVTMDEKTVVRKVIID